LLTLAEELQEKIDANTGRVTNLILMGIGVVFLLTFVYTFAAIIAPGEYAAVRRAATAGMAAYAGGAIALLALREMRTRQQIRRDERALYEIVDILREIEAGVARNFGLSVMERAEIRIRLSRLGIGTGGGDMVGEEMLLRRSPADRETRTAALLAIRALAGQKLSEEDRAKLTPPFIALLAIEGKLTPTAQERSKLTVDELMLLVCREKLQLNAQEQAQLTEEVKAIMLRKAPAR
jgi:hypothetical protein